MDVDRARHESPFGTTIAHGYLTLTLGPRFGYEVGVVPADVSQAFNYGMDGKAERDEHDR